MRWLKVKEVKKLLMVLSLVLVFVGSVSATSYVLRIDDLSFGSGDYNVVKNAVHFCRDYNVTFDLGVIAQRYRDWQSSATLSLYEANKDCFVISGHGLTHRNPVDPTSTGEFYDKVKGTVVPYDTQLQHVLGMEQIFNGAGVDFRGRMFLPGTGGDQNTISILSSRGYSYVAMSNACGGDQFCYVNGTLFSETNAWHVPQVQRPITYTEIQATLNDIKYYEGLGTPEIDVMMHRENFMQQEYSDELIHTLADYIKSKNPVPDPEPDPVCELPVPDFKGVVTLNGVEYEVWYIRK